MPIKETWGVSTTPTIFGATSCMSVPHLSVSQSHRNLSPQCHRIWRLWKTFRSRDEALIIGICALLDPKQLPGPLPCEGTRHVSMIGNLSLSSISALPVSRAVSKDIFGDEPTCVPHYGSSNGRRQLASSSAPKRPAQTCKLFANDPTRLS